MAEEKVGPCVKLVEAGERVTKLEVLLQMALDNDARMLALIEALTATDARIEERLTRMDNDKAKMLGGATVLMAIGTAMLWLVDKLLSKVS